MKVGGGMTATLRFENRTATGIGEDADIVKLRVDREAVPQIMLWYGSHCAGDDYDVSINGQEVAKDQNGEFEPITIDASL